MFCLLKGPSNFQKIFKNHSLFKPLSALRSYDYIYQMNNYSVTMLLYFNIQPPPQIISPFHKEDETKSNEQKVNDSMATVKKMIAQEDTWILRARTEGARERLVPSQVVQ